MTRRDIPEQWVLLLEKHGIHSARQLAERLDVGPSTATRLLHGEQTSDETVERAAKLLHQSPEEIRHLRGEAVLPPFRLPSTADHLTPRQRQAVLAVVRAMLEPTESAEDERDVTTLAELSDPVGIVQPVAATPRRRRK